MSNLQTGIVDVTLEDKTFRRIDACVWPLFHDKASEVPDVDAARLPKDDPGRYIYITGLWPKSGSLVLKDGKVYRMN